MKRLLLAAALVCTGHWGAVLGVECPGAAQCCRPSQLCRLFSFVLAGAARGYVFLAGVL